MKEKALVFLATGFEEIEAITPIDLLKRAGIEVVMVSVCGQLQVVGAHQITVTCDLLLDDVNALEYSILVVPGGPGYKKISDSKMVCDMLIDGHKHGKTIAAICAAPSILGKFDILIGKRACCFPGFEGDLSCKEVIMHEPTVVDGNVITSRGAGTAFSFGLAIVEKVLGKEKADKLAAQTIYCS